MLKRAVLKFTAAILGLFLIINTNAYALPSLAKTLSESYNIPDPAVIAHRGASYYAPEGTKAAYQLACHLGVDYLEADLQQTKDGELVAFHDRTLQRTTNITNVFPDRANDPVSSFTLSELKQLDAGSWFNHQYPQRARKNFNGLKILTLSEVQKIAENCPEHQPGLYLETKFSEETPDIAKDLKNALLARHWIGSSAHRLGRSVILQTFSKEGLAKLQQQMTAVPKILLLWAGKDSIEIKETQPQGENESNADYYARLQVKSQQAYADWLDYAMLNGAVGVGPATTQHAHDGKFSQQFSYMELAKPWMIKLIHEKGLLAHVYTVDQQADIERLKKLDVDGYFTDRPALVLKALKRAPAKNSSKLLEKIGF